MRHASTIGKSLLNSNISSTCSHNTVNFGPLAAEIGLPVWNTPGKFQRVSRVGFVTAPTSLNRDNQTLDDVWPSLGLVHYIYIFGRGLLPPLQDFPDYSNHVSVSLSRFPGTLSELCARPTSHSSSSGYIPTQICKAACCPTSHADYIRSTMF